MGQGLLGIENLFMWIPTAYTRYMWEEIASEDTNVSLGSVIGNGLEPVNNWKYASTQDQFRLAYTPDAGLNAYIVGDATNNSFTIPAAREAFGFMYRGPRRWTVAVKYRLKAATNSHAIIDCNGLNPTAVGFGLDLSLGNDQFNFVIGFDTQNLIMVLAAPTIPKDTDWHDLVVSSAGPGFEEVELILDGVSHKKESYQNEAPDIGDTSAFDLTIGRVSSGAGGVMNCDIADLIITNDLIAPSDLTLWRNFSQVPTPEKLETPRSVKNSINFNNPIVVSS